MKNKFSRWESICILANAMLYRSMTYAAGGVFSTAGSGGTLSAVIAAAAALVLLFFLLTLYRRYSAEPITRVFKNAAAQKVISFAVALFLLISAVCALCSFSSLVKSLAYPNTPIWYIFIFFAVASLCGGLGKRRSTASAHAIIFPIVAGATVVLCLSSLAHANPSNLFPALGFGGGTVLRGALRALALYADAILIFLVAEDLSEPKSLRSVGMTAAGIAAVFNIAIPLCFQLITLNMSELTQVTPIFALTEAISYGRFFQHPAALFLTFWAMSGILYCAAAIHYAVRAARNLKAGEVSEH